VRDAHTSRAHVARASARLLPHLRAIMLLLPLFLLPRSASTVLGGVGGLPLLTRLVGVRARLASTVQRAVLVVLRRAPRARHRPPRWGAGSARCLRARLTRAGTRTHAPCSTLLPTLARRRRGGGPAHSAAQFPAARHPRARKPPRWRRCPGSSCAGGCRSPDHCHAAAQQPPGAHRQAAAHKVTAAARQ